jgi:hypothetical protein
VAGLYIIVHPNLDIYSCWTYIVCPEFCWSELTLILFLLCSAAGPHTTIDGKDVVNFASANYIGLIGNEKILVRQNSIV